MESWSHDLWTSVVVLVQDFIERLRLLDHRSVVLKLCLALMMRLRVCEGFGVAGMAPAGSRSKSEAPKLMFGRLI